MGVTTPDVDAVTALFFPLLGGLLPFPFPTNFLPCPPGVQLSELEDLHLLYYWLQQQVVVM